MKLDRHLIAIAVFMLFIQLIWLAHELQIIHLAFLGKNNANQKAEVIGKIISIHNNVRKRPQSEIIWIEGREQEEVKVHDALLTLKNSTMKVQLTNGAELNLSENTLVYLEPVKGDATDQSIRIRFAHGSLRSKLNLQATDFRAESWIISPQSGAEFQLKSFKDGKIEIEMNKGNLSAEIAGKSVSFKQGEVAVLSQDQTFSKGQLLSELKWQTGKNEYLRHYAHHFPTNIQINWLGAAENLVVYQNSTISRTYPLGQDERRKVVELDPGSYELRIEKLSGFSSWLRLDVWNAPVIHLMNPLPRDRYQVGENLKYIWLNPREITSYVWELEQKSDEGELKGPIESIPVDANSDFLYRSQQKGQYDWQVIGKDQDGWRIPPPYANAIYYVERPLDAPELKQIEIRKPATKDPSELPEPRINKQENQKIKKRQKENKGEENRKATEDQRSSSSFYRPLNRMGLIFATIGKVLAQQMSEVSEQQMNEAEESEETELIQRALRDEGLRFDRRTHFLRLTWSQVADSEFYVIEVSKTPDFRKLMLEKKVQDTRYDWNATNLQSDVFYWRVASGSRRQMGRFSQVQEVDLKKLNEGKHYLGISIVPQNKSQENSNKGASLRKSFGKAVGETLGKREGETVGKISGGGESEATDLVFENTERFFTAGLVFENSEFLDSNSTQYRYSGLSLKLRYGLDANLDNDFRIGAAISAQLMNWKNVDRDSIMFGENFAESKMRLISWLGKKKSRWTSSFGFGYVALPVRSGLETMRFDTSIVFSLGVWYDWTRTSYFQGKAGLIASAGSSVNDISFVYYGQRQLRKSEFYVLNWGPELEISTVRSSLGTTGVRYHLGALLGLTW